MGFTYLIDLCFCSQIVRMNNERFAIPEVLFNPSDIGIQEMGISEAIVHSINSCPAGKTRLGTLLLGDDKITNKLNIFKMGSTSVQAERPSE